MSKSNRCYCCGAWMEPTGSDTCGQCSECTLMSGPRVIRGPRCPFQMRHPVHPAVAKIMHPPKVITPGQFYWRGRLRTNGPGGK